MLTRWQTAGILDAEHCPPHPRLGKRAEEARRVALAGLVVLVLGAILLACGVALFVSAHWDKIGPGARFAVVLGMVSLFHLGGSWARKRFRVLSTALHAVGTLSTGAAIALVGQIFNIRGALAGGGADVGSGRPGRMDSAARRGATDADAAALPGVVAFGVFLLRRGPHRRKRLCGPIFDRLGGSLPDLFPRLQTQNCPGDSLRCCGDCLRRGSCRSAGGLALVGQPDLSVSRNPHLGLGFHCRDSAALCGLQVLQERDSRGCRDLLLDCAALVPTILEDITLRRYGNHDYPLRSANPTSPLTRWLRHSPSSSSGGACGRLRRRWSTWALWASPSPWAGSTSATLSTSLAARWA